MAIPKLNRDQSLRSPIEGGTGDQRSLRTNGRKPRIIWVGLFEAHRDGEEGQLVRGRIKKFPQFFKEGEWLTERTTWFSIKKRGSCLIKKKPTKILLEAHGFHMGIDRYKGEDSESILLVRMGPRGRAANFQCG